MVEGFFTGVFESKGVDRSGFLVRCPCSLLSLPNTIPGSLPTSSAASLRLSPPTQWDLRTMGETDWLPISQSLVDCECIHCCMMRKRDSRHVPGLVLAMTRGVCCACGQDLLLRVSEQAGEGFADAQVLERGLKLVLDNLDQTAVDVPFAPELVRRNPTLPSSLLHQSSMIL